MKLVELKNARELKLPGVSVEFITEGNVIKELILRPDGEEESYSLKAGPSYTESMKVFKRVTHELVERFRLSGTVLGIQVQQDFETDSAAHAAMARLRSANGDTDLTVAPVMVRVDENGEPTAPALADSEIPF